LRLPSSSTLFPYTTLFRSGDVEILGDRKFDTIIANIQRNILMEDIPKYAKVLNFTNGELILSGLMEEDFEDIKSKCEENGLEFVDRKSTRLNSSHVKISYA